MKFRYTVTTPQNKTLTGIIAAISMDMAHKNLQRLGYVVLSLMPVLDDRSRLLEKKTFSFEARNTEGKKILGTISTSNEYTAKKKLEQDHGLTILKLTEINTTGPIESQAVKTIQEEATMVLQKAEQLLQDISPYDPDYNSVFDVKEETRNLLRSGDYKQVEKKIVEMLELLQNKEKSTIMGEKEKSEEGVVKATSDLITSIKIEAEDTVKNRANFYMNAVLRELATLSQWLLMFYGVYFVFAEVVTMKNTQLNWIVFLKNTILSSLLFKIALSVLLLHVYCRLKLYWLEDKMLSSVLLGFVIALFMLWIFLI